MKKYFTIIIVYIFVVMLAIRLFAEVFSDTWFASIGVYLMLSAIFIMLVHIGILMQNVQIKRRYFFYISIIAGEIILYILVKVLFNLSTEHNYLDIIISNIIFFTLLKMIFDMAKITKSSNEKVSRTLRIISIIGAFTIIWINIFTLVFGL